MSWDKGIRLLVNSAFTLFLMGIFCSMFRQLHDVAALCLVVSILFFLIYVILVGVKKILNNVTGRRPKGDVSDSEDD